MREAAKRGRLAVGAGLVLASVAATTIAGLALGDSGTRGAHNTTSGPRRYAVLSFESPHVASSYSTYSVSPGQEGPGLPPTQALTSPASFKEPIATYIRYAEDRLAAAGQQAGLLLAALQAGDRETAEKHWRMTYSDYLQLGAVYLTGSLSALNQRIDGTPGGIPGGVKSSRFTGLHRIEYGLWTGAPPASLARYAADLQSNLEAMARLLPRAGVTPPEYDTRAHEILEDAQRDLLSGAAVPWSGEGVLGTAAGLSATEEVIATLHGLLHEEDGEHPPVGPPIEAELATLRSVLRSIAAAHGGSLPGDADLTPDQNERLQGALGGALEALAQVPPALEAEPAPKPLRIPPKAERIDP